MSALILTSAASAYADPLFIENHSFENPTLGSGSFFYSPTLVPGWTATATGGPDRGVWNTSAAGKDGQNISFAYRNNALAQQLVYGLVGGGDYTLTWLMGRTGNATRGTVELWAGGTVANGVVTGGTLLASSTNQLDQDPMTEYSLNYVAPTTGSIIGQTLAIRLVGTMVSGESYVSFDNIRLAGPVPEPATIAALGLGFAGVMRRRRKSRA